MTTNDRKNTVGANPESSPSIKLSANLKNNFSDKRIEKLAYLDEKHKNYTDKLQRAGRGISPDLKTSDNYLNTNFTTTNSNKPKFDVNFVYDSTEKCKI